MQTLFPKQKTIKIKGKLVDVDKPLVMGILNLTPDSFYDGGKYQNEKSQMKYVEQMINEGADIIDIGAQSSRPGAKEIGADEEIKRFSNIIKLIKKEIPEAVISIDTWHSKVAEFAANQGADMINDISAGQFDEKMFDTIAEINLPYIIMHTRDKPDKMQDKTNYESVLKEILYYFSEKINKLALKGVNDIIIDPGFGFSKTLEQNYYLMNHLKELNFTEKLILVGVSRKSMVTKALNVKSSEALTGTIALHMKALLNGADILRVHDVKEAKQTIEIYHKLIKNQ